jgi:hypothetical protein
MVSLKIDQTPILPPEAGLNLNPCPYQSDEWGSQVGFRAFPGPFVQLDSPPWLAGRKTLSPRINTAWWHLAGAALPVGLGY